MGEVDRTLKGVNGISYGLSYVVTTQDATDEYVLFKFDVKEKLVAIIRVYNTDGIEVAMTDAVVTYPEDGQVKLENGAATFTLTATYRIDLVAQPYIA